jgi:hypothetical protein
LGKLTFTNLGEMIMANPATFYNFYPTLTPVRLASTANVAGTYLNGPLNNGVGATLTIAGGLTALDAINLNLNDSVLLDAQTNANENGIYTVTTLGTPTVLTRRVDFQSVEQMKEGQSVAVGAGATLAGSTWVLVEPLPGHLGVDPLTFVHS